MLSINGLWRAELDDAAVVVGVDIGEDGGGEDESMIFDEAEIMELGTGPGKGVVVEVEPVLRVGMLDACTLAAIVVGIGVSESSW